jgi:hypothetical protein
MKRAASQVLSFSLIFFCLAVRDNGQTKHSDRPSTQEVPPQSKPDLSTWQTVSLDGKGIKFKLPPGWRHDGMDMEAKHETLTMQEIDWNAPNKGLSQGGKIRIFRTVFDNGFLWFGHPMTREEMLEHELDRATSAAQSGAPGVSYSDVKAVKVSGIEGVFSLMRVDSRNKEMGTLLFLQWTGYRVYQGRAEVTEISISSAPKGEELLRSVFSTLEVEQDKSPQ